ncbi:MAG TPA: DedA family protein [Terriglobales bacterium]|nr:DedA family protein [Terriglobales bacterium]
MSDHLFHLLRDFFHHYGYWTIAVLLLLEHAGIPLPGETTLLFASFLAYSERHLHLDLIILSGTLAAALGGELGYLIGHHGGRPMLLRYQHIFRIRQAALERGERLFERHGSWTVFFARFIFGMRILAGPLAGVLRMDRKRFSLFNLLGALSWVTVISLLGYFFGSQWPRLVRDLKDADLAVLAVAAVAVLLGYWRWRRERLAEERSQQ